MFVNYIILFLFVFFFRFISFFFFLLFCQLLISWFSVLEENRNDAHSFHTLAPALMLRGLTISFISLMYLMFLILYDAR